MTLRVRFGDWLTAAPQFKSTLPMLGAPYRSSDLPTIGRFFMSVWTEDAGQIDTRPRLIGASSVVSDTCPPYYNPLVLDGGGTVSVDMVRFSLTFSGDGGDWLIGHADAFACDEVSSWTSKVAVGKYHVVWRFGFGESSLTLGVGFTEPSCKVNMSRGFVEFNPNKIGHDVRVARLLQRVSAHVVHAVVSRYDLAYDLPVDRGLYRLTRDRRAYTCIISNGMTEYLGRRNKSGFVKLYDKAAEVGMDTPLTRVELTCDGTWGVDEVIEHWPEVHCWSVAGKERSWLRVVGMLLAEHVSRGGEVESYVGLLGRVARDKVRKCLRTSMVELPACAVEHVVAEVGAWRDRAEGVSLADACLKLVDAC